MCRKLAVRVAPKVVFEDDAVAGHEIIILIDLVVLRNQQQGRTEHEKRRQHQSSHLPTPLQNVFLTLSYDPN